MRKIFLFLIQVLFLSPLLAQKGFESKKHKPSGEFPKNVSGVIDGSKQTQRSLGYGLSFHSDIYKEADGSVSFIRNRAYSHNKANARKTTATMTYEFINSVKNDVKINNPKEEFKILSEDTDDNGNNHLKLQQYHNDIPIYGAESHLHSNQSGVFENWDGRIYPSYTTSLNPELSSEEAIEAAYNDVKKVSIYQKTGAVGKLLSLQPDKAELFIYPEESKQKLFYEVTVRPNIMERWVYWIHATTGEVMQKYNHTCTVDGIVTATSRDLNSVTRSMKLTQIGNSYYMMDRSQVMYNATKSKLPDNPFGVIFTVNAQNFKLDEALDNTIYITSSNANNWNSTGVSAQYNATVAYDYYKNTHNRNSLNGNGGNIISIINIADKDGKGMDQAFWNGQFMGYGNGQKAFKPLAGGLDVAGHEMSHGVIENSARLEYRNQSGALNESFADIFGAMVDRED
ncbi:MAG: M4 family metallopeptidase, partial [Leadbetterella sp.]